MSQLVFMEVSPVQEIPRLSCNELVSGHYERKMKHLNNQKEGKKKMKRIGTVDLPQEAFFDILSKGK